MAKRGRPAQGEQLALIDVLPENVGEIVEKAREYKAVQATRLKALEEEIKLKSEILELVDKAHLQRLENGVIRFKTDGFQISVTPRDSVIRIEEDKSSQNEELPPDQDKPSQKGNGRGRRKKQRKVGDIQGDGDKSMEQMVAETEDL